MTFQNVGLVLHEVLKLRFIADFGVVSDTHKRQQVLVYRARIDRSEITPNDPFAFEALYPRVNCRRGETKPLANGGVGNPGIILN